MGCRSSKSEGYSMMIELSKRDHCSTFEVKEDKSNKIRIIKIFNTENVLKEDKEKYKNSLKKVNELYIPHMCKIEDIKEDINTITIKMLKYNNSLESIKVLEYFAENGIEDVLNAICEFIGIFHANGLIYGNLKPSNIFVDDKNGYYYFSDYFSYLLTKNVKFEINDIIWLSPEMILNEELSEKSDIWSIGCLIYYLKSGNRIFGGESAKEIIVKIMNCRYYYLECEFDEVLNPLIEKLLKINASDRISINELKEEIEKIQSSIYLRVTVEEAEEVEAEVEVEGIEMVERIDEMLKIIQPQINPDPFTYYYELGKAKYDIGDYYTAITLFQNSLRYSYKEDDEMKCEVYKYLGYSYYELKKYDDSLISLNESIKYSSGINNITKCKIYKCMARSYYELNEFNESIAALKQSLMYSSGIENELRCEIYRNIGFAYYCLMEYNQAIKQLNKSLKYSSEVDYNTKFHIYRYRGECYYKLEKYNEAIESLIASLDYSSEEDESVICDIYKLIGQSYYFVKKYDKAIESLKESLKCSSDVDDEMKCEIYRYIGKSNYSKKKYGQSLNALKKSMKYSSTTSYETIFEMHRLIGECFYHLKQYKPALKSFKKALEYGDDDEIYSSEINNFIKKCYYNINNNKNK